MKTGNEVSEAAKKAAEAIDSENHSMHKLFGCGYADPETVAEIVQLAIDAQLASVVNQACREAIANARNDALEEAALHCENTSGFTGRDHASRIRALKKKSDKSRVLE